MTIDKKSIAGRINHDDHVQYINFGCEDQMELYGFKKSKTKVFITWVSYIMTIGLLRLLFHWYPRYRLLATHSPCSLELADKILVVDNYKGKYKLFFVETVTSIVSKDINGNSLDTNLTFYLEDRKREATSLRTFTCKRICYIWDTEREVFTRLGGLENGTTQAQLHNFVGFSEMEQYVRRLVYGNNEIDVPIETILKLFVLEALTPFYIFQVFSLIVWMCEYYYYYGIAIVIMSFLGIGSSIIQTRKNQSNLHGTVHLTDKITVRRDNGTFEDIPTTDLVPGDVLAIPSHGCIMHCDAALLNGNCIVNESMLTGESVPVLKTALPKHDRQFDFKDDTNHILYCGTKIIQTRYYGDEVVLAVVLRTGFLTSKGQLVRSIMYPPPADFKFDQDSYKFIGILAVIAIIGVVYTVASKYSRHISFGDIVIKALDTITIVIPPALPAAMTVGKLYALGRLKLRNIFCINSRIINVSGSINCVCFDKTGTLTEDGLDMWGVVPVLHNKLQPPVLDVKSLSESSYLLQGMVTCHSLTLIEEKLEGDPLDVKSDIDTDPIRSNQIVEAFRPYWDLSALYMIKHSISWNDPTMMKLTTDRIRSVMFESTGWTLEEPQIPDSSKYDLLVPTIVKPLQMDHNEEQFQNTLEIGIIHQNQFSSNLQRMSVITKTLGSNTFDLYCKGSPEMIISLSDPWTIPKNIVGTLNQYTEKGYRVIAMGRRLLESTNYMKIQKMKREEVECKLEFLGLIVLENKLKPQTTDIIKVLKEADMKIVMITGDNIQTALSVAKECGIIKKGCVIIDVEAKAPTKTEDAKIMYHKSIISSDSAVYEKLLDVEKSGREVKDFYFIMTGNAWGIIREYFPKEIPKLVTRGIVFARMSSDQKQQLVQELQELGYYVSMCGDGTNDCGALKAAHVGISLSEAESSVASPFTSRTPNISCVPEIIKEGRAALVTSFGIFKFMIAYSLTEFTSVIILYGIDSNLSSLQFLYIDICLILFFASLFGMTKAYEKKLVKQPPMTSLLSFIPLTSLTLHLLSVIIFQALAYRIIQTYDWFTPFEFIPDTNIYISYENYAIFSISLFQYITMAIIFSKGSPYRNQICTNYYFISSLILMIAICTYITLDPANWIISWLELQMPPQWDGRCIILVLAIINFFFAYIVEDFLVDFLLYKKIRPRFHNIDNSRKKYLKVEQELQLDSKWRMNGVSQFKMEHFGVDNVGFENEHVNTHLDRII